MNQDQLQGILKQLRGRAKQVQGTLVGDPMTVAAGARDRLAGRVQEQHGIYKALADQQLAEFMTRNRHWTDLSGR